MTATSGKQYAVGMRHARVYALNSFGVPSATQASTPYEGLQLTAAKAFELTIPDARRIAHTGDDSIQAQDVLPRLEPTSGVLRTGRNDHDVYAVLTGTNAFTIGEATGIGYGTSKQGSEPTVGVLMYQQSKDATSKVRRWRTYIMPATQTIINPASMNENVPEFEFNLIPDIAEQHMWGKAFAEGTEGFTTSEIVEFMNEGLPHIASWAGNGSATNFGFNASRQASAAAKVHAVTTCATDGTITDVTGTVTKSTTGVVFAVAPGSGVIVTAFYEYAAA